MPSTHAKGAGLEAESSLKHLDTLLEEDAVNMCRLAGIEVHAADGFH